MTEHKIILKANSLGLMAETAKCNYDYGFDCSIWRLEEVWLSITKQILKLPENSNSFAQNQPKLEIIIGQNRPLKQFCKDGAHRDFSSYFKKKSLEKTRKTSMDSFELFLNLFFVQNILNDSNQKIKKKINNGGELLEKEKQKVFSYWEKLNTHGCGCQHQYAIPPNSFLSFLLRDKMAFTREKWNTPMISLSTLKSL